MLIDTGPFVKYLESARNRGVKYVLFSASEKSSSPKLHSNDRLNSDESVLVSRIEVDAFVFGEAGQEKFKALTEEGKGIEFTVQIDSDDLKASAEPMFPESCYTVAVRLQ
ncbi:hypothetical protein [Marinobacter subterrani]|uniref:hypothetical protein n=1 Tax=Marinobacter subterrani TaxID=1658765 RepID=UPI002355EEC1|nr:hypothetical protein [Marinobacter subterrani]